MKLLFTISFAVGLICSAFSQQMTIYKSDFAVDETVYRLLVSLESNEVTHLGTINQDSLSLLAGDSIAVIRILLVEKPLLTSDLLSCRSTTAIDLPLKIMVWEEHEDIFIGFFDPMSMKKRFLLQECDQTIMEMSRMLLRVVNEVIKED
ncbi:MAG: DUF302 domain-containing protein [Bacteroidota bacterium]